MHISSTELLALDIRLAFSTHVQHTSALCLSKLFLERSVKHQAHYFSRLETRKTQLTGCETRLKTRFSKFSRIENRVSSRVSRLESDCQLTFERYCRWFFAGIFTLISFMHNKLFCIHCKVVSHKGEIQLSSKVSM